MALYSCGVRGMPFCVRTATRSAAAALAESLGVLRLLDPRQRFLLRRKLNGLDGLASR